MATKKVANKVYGQKGIPTSIRATSRCAIKVGETYYTIEANEERHFDEVDGLDLKKEWQFLFDSVNAIVDEQAEEIVELKKDF